MLRADLEALRSCKQRVAPFVFPNLFAVASYRLSRVLQTRGHAVSARLVSVICHLLTGADIDPQATIGAGLVLEHTSGIVVGPGVVAGEGLRLFGGALLGATFNGPKSQRARHGFPRLGDDVQVMAKASVLGPVSVGNHAIVGAHTLVLDDVPAGGIAVGVPARCRRLVPS